VDYLSEISRSETELYKNFRALLS